MQNDRKHKKISQHPTYKRNKEITKAIDKNYNYFVTSSAEEGYVYRGRPSYKYEIDLFYIDTQEILNKKDKESTSQLTTIIDVGAGNFILVDDCNESYKHIRAYGIGTPNTAGNTYPDELHILNNAEYLDQIFGKEKFDLIFSNMTFRHFVDPIGSLIEAYNTLKPGGVMLIDRFHVPGCENYVTELIAYLKERGYVVVAVTDNIEGNISNFILKKTIPKLDIPVTFNKIIENRVQYAPTKVLKKMKDKTSQSFEFNSYQQARDTVLTTAKHLLNAHSLNEINDLVTLFRNENYKKLSVQEQYLCLIAVAAKSISHEEMLELTKKSDVIMAEDAWIRGMLNDDPPNTLFSLSFNEMFMAKSPDTQLMLIQTAAIRAIFNFSDRIQQKNALIEMGITFKEKKPGEILRSKYLNLNFSFLIDKMSTDNIFFTNENKYKRTAEANLAIDESFNHLLTLNEEAYIRKGNPSYGFAMRGISLDTDAILDTKTKEMDTNNLPITVLDIGAGDFTFKLVNDRKYQGKVLTYGISASDRLLLPQHRVKDEYHVFGNAEYLSSKIYGKDQFDLIFSATTFVHFIDPIGSIIEAYNALKPGGVLVIDQFSLPGCGKYASHLVSYLKQQGYTVTSDVCTSSTITNFVIQKTADKPELIFPLEFDGTDDSNKTHKVVKYKPNSALKEYYQKNPDLKSEEYEKGRRWIRNEVEKKLPANILNQCNSLPALFANAEYQKLKSELQYLCILAVVAKTVSYKDYANIVSACLNEDKRGDSEDAEFKDAFLRLHGTLSSSTDSYLPFLRDNANFEKYQLLQKTYSPEQAREQQLRIVTLNAMYDLIRSGGVEDSKTILEQMNLSYKDSNRLGISSESRVLLFPDLKETRKTNEKPHKRKPSIFSQPGPSSVALETLQEMKQKIELGFADKIVSAIVIKDPVEKKRVVRLTCDTRAHTIALHKFILYWIEKNVKQPKELPVLEKEGEKLAVELNEKSFAKLCERFELDKDRLMNNLPSTELDISSQGRLLR